MSDNNEEILNEDQTMKTVGEIFSDVGPSHEYSAGPNIEIENWEISGRDWNDAIDSAVFPKQDKLIAGDYILINDISGQPVISVTGIGDAGSNSWKQYSEDNDSVGDGIYIGEDNTVENEFSVAIGNNNEIDVIVDGTNEYQNVTLGNNNTTIGEIPDKSDYIFSAFDSNIGEFNKINHTDHSNSEKETLAINIGNKNTIDNEGVNIGKYNNAAGYGVTVGKYNSAYSGSYLFGERSTVYSGSIGVGKSISAAAGSIAVGVDAVYATYGGVAFGARGVSADNGAIAVGHQGVTAKHDGISFGGNSICAYDNSLVLSNGYSTASNNSMAVGRNISAKSLSYIFGYSNTGSNNSLIVGFSNTIDNTDNNSAENISIFGKSNNVDDAFGEYTVIGNNNRLINKTLTSEITGTAGGFGVTVGNNNTIYSMGFNSVIGTDNTVWGPTYILGSGNYAYNYGLNLLLGFGNIDFSAGPFNTQLNDKGHATLIGVKNTHYGQSARSGSYENMSVLMGGYNTAFGNNLFAIGSRNYVGSTVNSIITATDNDGHAFAIGNANTAVRNYDMAIGLSSIASGGENLVIGAAPYKFNNITVPESECCSKAIGTCNLAIRSNISGRNNKAFQSFVSADCDGFIFNNVNFNLLDDSFIIIDNNSLEFYNNDVKKSVIRVHGNNFNYNNLYKCDGLTITAYQSDNNTFKYIENDKSLTLSASDTISRNTIISNVQGTAETNHFVDNIIMNNSKINVVSSRYISNNIILNNAQFITEQSDDKYGMNNCIINVQGKNIEGTFGFGDGSSPFVTDAIRTLCFGDFSVTHATESTIINQSTATNVEGTFIFGKGNRIVLDSTQYDNTYRYSNWGDTIHESYILGTDNYLSAENASDKISRNNIIGNNNIISVYDGISNNTIIGINNTIAELYDNISLYDLYDNDINGYTLSSFKSGPGYATYRNHILGNNNFISQYISDSKIIGHGNAIYTTTIKENDTYRSKFNSLYDSSVVIGSKNILQNGSNQFAVGTFNNLSGHYAYALGNNLSAQDNQIIVGKYNEPVDNTIIFKYKYDYETSTIIEQDVSSGVIFAVSNGYFDGYEKITTDTYGVTAKIFKGNTTSATNITDNTCMVRSNAMIVSADGTVSAKKFISEEGTIYIEDAPLTGGPWVRDAGQWVQLTAYLNSLGE